ncbi:MAG: 50S ribosomal protein L35ae [Candidatus Woesearchaeota archaeon]|nr:50S ribosomal protein L35ae [Candidatus Woesearchaeota archaeon]
MDGLIVSFRGSRRTRIGNHIIIKVEGVTKKEEAVKLIGKKVSWKSPAGKEIKGEVMASHGNKGAIRAIFEKGLPGQSLGTKVKIE